MVAVGLEAETLAVQGLAVHPASAWATRLGLLPVDRAAITKLLTVFETYDNEADAVRSFSSSASV